MIFDTEFFEEHGVVFFKPENEEETEFLKHMFYTRHPTNFGLNADGSISLLTTKSRTKWMKDEGIVQTSTGSAKNG